MRLAVVATLSLVTACALRAPTGTKELIEDIRRDRASVPKDFSILEGAPVFIKVRAYPRATDQAIYGHQWLLVKRRRKPINPAKLLEELKSDD